MSEEDPAAVDPAAADRAAADHRAVVALQAALLPTGVPVLPRAVLGAAYLLAEADAGGDWYDAVVRTDGSLGLVVGDVVGHGVAAVATMGQLRAVARHFLDTAESPAAVVTELDRLARRLPGARSATVCVAVLHPTSGTVRYCTAGHPRPLLVPAAGPAARYLAASGDGPLFSGSSYHDRVDHLSDGDLLLLYTDGIVAEPGRAPERTADGLVDVAVAAAQRRSTGGGRTILGVAPDLDLAQRVCDQTLVGLADRTGRRDDVALLAVSRHPPVGIVELTLPDTLAAVPTVRAALDVWLDALHVDRLAGAAVQHAVREIVTNAVVHAHPGAPPGTHHLTVRAELTAVGQLEVTVTDSGRWQPPVPGLYRGVGLALAAELVDELVVERTPGQNAVCLRRTLTQPVPMLTTTAPPAAATSIATAPSALDRSALDRTTLDRSALSAAAAVDDPPFATAVAENAGRGAVLEVSGPVDAVTATALRDQLCTVTEGGTVTRTVDLSRVTLLSSAGVSVLWEARRRSLAHHEQLHLLAPPGSPAGRVLELVGLGQGDRRPEP